VEGIDEEIMYRFSHIVVMSPLVSWLFFQGASEAPISEIEYGSSEQTRKTANWPRPGGFAFKMGRRPRLLVGYVIDLRYAPLMPVRLEPPCRRPILNATTFIIVCETVH